MNQRQPAEASTSFIGSKCFSFWTAQSSSFPAAFKCANLRSHCSFLIHIIRIHHPRPVGCTKSWLATAQGQPPQAAHSLLSPEGQGVATLLVLPRWLSSVSQALASRSSCQATSLATFPSVPITINQFVNHLQLRFKYRNHPSAHKPSSTITQPYAPVHLPVSFLTIHQYTSSPVWCSDKLSTKHHCLINPSISDDQRWSAMASVSIHQLTNPSFVKIQIGTVAYPN